MRRLSLPERRAWANAWADAVRASSLGWDLALPIVGGVVIGDLLARRAGNGYVYTLGFLAAGIFVGLYNVGRRLRAEIARDERRRERAASASREGDDR